MHPAQNTSTEQLFHNREKLAAQYESIRGRIQAVEQEIAYASCPFCIAQRIVYDINPKAKKRVSGYIVGIHFQPTPPFYRMYFAPTVTEGVEPTLLIKAKIIIRSLKGLVGLNNVDYLHAENPEAYQKRLQYFISQKYLIGPKDTVLTEDVIPDICQAAARSANLARLGPSALKWLDVLRRLKSRN